jgi:hypothetical protein
MRSSFAFLASLLLLGCNATIIGGAGTGGGETSETTTTSPGEGGAGTTTTTAVDPVDPITCESSATAMIATVPSPMLATGGTVEITLMPDPGGNYVSTAITSVLALGPGAGFVPVPSDGHSAAAVMFFDPTGALVGGAIMTPSTTSTTPANPQTRLVPAQFTSIQAAIDASQPGDTVLVAPGVYTEHLTLRSGIHLQGSGAEQTTLDGLGQSTSLIMADDVRGASVRGFRFVNLGSETGCATSDVLNCGGDYHPAAIHALASEFSCDPTTTLLIADNVFEDNHLAVMIGWHGYALLRHNIFRDNEHGLVVNSGSYNHLLVRENVFFQNAHAIEGDASFIHLDHNVIAQSGVGIRHAHVQTAPPRCNAFFGNGVDYQEDFGSNAASPLGTLGNTSFDGEPDLAAAIAEGCFGAEPPNDIGFGTFAGAFGEAFEATL